LWWRRHCERLLCSNNQRAVQCAIYFSNTPRPRLVPKNFRDFSSHRIFRHIFRVLNIDEKKLITQFGRKPRDEFFELN
jgi:hypothetical protein